MSVLDVVVGAKMCVSRDLVFFFDVWGLCVGGAPGLLQITEVAIYA